MIYRIVARNIICILTFASVLSCMQRQVRISYNVFRREDESAEQGGRGMSVNTGKNIKTLRQFYGETQEELGSSMNVSGASISYFENEQRSPDVEMTKRIAQHYGITMDQMVGSELPVFKNIGVFPDVNVDLGVMFRAAYPFASADTDNENFNSGCQAAERIVKSINSSMPVMESMIDHAIRLFEKAIEETGMPEATVNYLLMLILKWDSLRNEEDRAREKEAIAADSLKVDQEFMKKNYLGRDRSLGKKEAERKEKFIEKYGEKIIEKTRELKGNKDWSDFADYYQALRYLADMINISENDKEHNVNAGIERMISLVLLGNKYAIEFVRQPIGEV